MKKIDLKSMNTLEYFKVINQLSGFAVSELGRETIKELKPSRDYDKVLKMLEETDDVVLLNDLKGGFPLGSFKNIRPYLKRMEIGGFLSGEEMVEIGHALKGVREINEYFEELKEELFELKQLYNLSDQIVLLSSLEKLIYSTLSESGEVLDKASPELRSIRNKTRQAENNVRDRLNQIIRGQQAKYLTDSIITMRNNRYVVPVKAENRNVFGGIVHSQSSTGQTLYIEPQNVLDLNNRLKQLESEEKHEVERILTELSVSIVPYSEEVLTNLEILTQFDVLQAKGKFAREMKATRPQVNKNQYINLMKARHPLIPDEEIVANDIKIGDTYKTIVVTGPNTGGKTVILKTLGLLQLMGQTGLYLPVEAESSIGVFDHILSDIGDEQSIEQSLSTFSSHLTTIVSILEELNENSLVLLDELGAGTDPQEGAALAIAILDKISAVGSLAMITSHYPELKLYGYNRPETMNASMEFDIATLQPTYKFKMGIPGRSNAFEIAKRLGMKQDIIETAKTLMTSESQSVDEMISDLDMKQKETEESSKELRKKLLETQRLHNELKRAYRAYKDEEKDLKKKAEEEANKIVRKAQEKTEKIISDLRQKQMDIETGPAIKEHEFIEVQSQLSDLQTEKQALKDNKVLQAEKSKQALKVGQSVNVHSLGQTGTLVEEVDGQWVVQMGMLKMKLPANDLTVIAEEKEPKETQTTYYGSASSVRPELDLRGERVESALTKLDQYIDQALLANYKNVTIIHGHGTGAVRSAVQERLKTNRRVKSYKIAPANQGGAGATIVTFK